MTRVRKFDGDVMVNLSSGQSTPIGKIVGHIYYSNHALCDMAPGCSGYPHNGGEHTMHLRGSRGDIKAFIELIVDAYKDNKILATVVPEFQQIIKEVEMV